MSGGLNLLKTNKATSEAAKVLHVRRWAPRLSRRPCFCLKCSCPSDPSAINHPLRCNTHFRFPDCLCSSAFWFQCLRLSCRQSHKATRWDQNAETHKQCGKLKPPRVLCPTAWCWQVSGRSDCQQPYLQRIKPTGGEAQHGRLKSA